MRFNYNQSILVGRLTKDPDYKQLTDTLGKLHFYLAINRRKRKGLESSEETDFIPVCLFGKLAELGRRLLKKGHPVLIWGRLQIRHYDKDDKRHWVTEVIGENFQLQERAQPNQSLDTDLDVAVSEALILAENEAA